MNKIQPKDARYIKLGSGSLFERACIEKDSSIRIDYATVPRDKCLAGEWDDVRQWFIDKQGSDPGAATRHRAQIRDFYEADADMLWVTFYNNRLWWCFAQPDVILLPDDTKVRKTVDGWHSTDVTGEPLDMGYLNGQLLSMQGFRGTICRVKLFDYLVRKINANKSPVEQEVEAARVALTKALTTIIKALPWKEFEMLVDLIFRQAGWQRISQVGKTQKSLDLDLLSPIASERYFVQIKSRAARQQFEAFVNETEGIEEYGRYYFVVHSPYSSLTKDLETDLYKLWLTEDIANLVMQYGLTDWVIAKTL